MSNWGGGSAVEHVVLTLHDCISFGMTDRAVWSEGAVYYGVVGIQARGALNGLLELSFFLGFR